MNNLRLYIGVDPGLHGAVAMINEMGNLISVQDTPIIHVKRGTGGKNVYVETQMFALLQALSETGTIACVGIENQHSRPGQGAPATFSQGFGFGLWIMALAALKLPYEKIEPMNWKKAMSIPPKSDKSASIVKALQLFPRADIHRKKDDGRAESLLISEYLRRKLTVK